MKASLTQSTIIRLVNAKSIMQNRLDLCSFLYQINFCNQQAKFKSNAGLLIHFSSHSGFMSAGSGPLFLKSYSSAACNVALMHTECVVDCTTLGRNVLNLNHNP